LGGRCEWGRRTGMGRWAGDRRRRVMEKAGMGGLEEGKIWVGDLDKRKGIGAMESGRLGEVGVGEGTT